MNAKNYPRLLSLLTALILFATVTAQEATQEAPEMAPPPGVSETVIHSDIIELGGQNYQQLLILVTLEPGAESGYHDIPTYVVIYVLEGDITEYMSGDRVARSYGPGSTIQEWPGGHHNIVNHSGVPAKALVFLLLPLED